MTGTCANILETIGRTPVVRINRLAPPGINLFVKVEAFNPLGSIKDRLALGVIEDAGRRGQLRPGQTVVEATSGNTGIGLAMVCAQKGYPLVVTMSENFSIERRKLMRFLGARVVLTPRRAEGQRRRPATSCQWRARWQPPGISATRDAGLVAGFHTEARRGRQHRPLHATGHRRVLPVDAAVCGHPVGHDRGRDRAFALDTQLPLRHRTTPTAPQLNAPQPAAPPPVVTTDTNAFVDEVLADATQAVVMFSLEWCEFCWSVRHMFARFGIPYRSIDLDSVAYQKDGRGGKIRAALTARTSMSTRSRILTASCRPGYRPAERGTPGFTRDYPLLSSRAINGTVKIQRHSKGSC